MLLIIVIISFTDIQLASLTMAVFSSTQVGMLIVLTAIAVLYQVELDYDPLIVQEKAVVARSPEDVFKFMSDVFNYPEVTMVFLLVYKIEMILWCNVTVAEQLRAPEHSSSGVSDQQSVGFESWSWHLCPFEQDT